MLPFLCKVIHYDSPHIGLIMLREKIQQSSISGKWAINIKTCNYLHSAHMDFCFFVFEIKSHYMALADLDLAV